MLFVKMKCIRLRIRNSNHVPFLKNTEHVTCYFYLSIFIKKVTKETISKIFLRY